MDADVEGVARVDRGEDDDRDPGYGVCSFLASQCYRILIQNSSCELVIIHVWIWARILMAAGIINRAVGCVQASAATGTGRCCCAAGVCDGWAHQPWGAPRCGDFCHSPSLLAGCGALFYLLAVGTVWPLALHSSTYACLPWLVSCVIDLMSFPNCRAVFCAACISNLERGFE